MRNERHRKTDPTHFQARLASGEDLLSILDGIDPFEPDAAGECLMHLAAKLDLGLLCHELGKELPELAHARDAFGLTPLMLAAAEGKLASARALMPISEIDARASRGGTALLFAAKYGHAEIVKLLAESGADPTARDLHGSSLLHMAARAKLDKGFIQWALPLCDPSLLDGNGLSALDALDKNFDPEAKSFKAALERGILELASGEPKTERLSRFSL